MKNERIKAILPFLLLLFVLAVSSCDFMSQLASNQGNTDIKVNRMDRIEYQYITTGEFSALQQMSTAYPTETRTLIEDILKIGKMDEEATTHRMLSFYQDSTLQSVIRDAEEKFANMDQLNKDLTAAFKRVNELFPQISIPTVYSQISAFDQSIVIKDGSIGISIDKYLGSDYPAYREFFDEKQRKMMTPKMIVPDCVLFYLINSFPLKDFDNATQEQKDEHIGKILWATNQIVGFKAYDDAPLERVEKLVQKNPGITIPEMLGEE